LKNLESVKKLKYLDLNNKNEKKTILIFLGSLTGGGAERVAVNLSKYLSGTGEYDVTVATLSGTDRDFYVLNGDIKRVAMNLEGETSGWGKFTVNIRRVVQFRKILKVNKPDLVISFMTRYSVIALLSRFFLNIKIIVSERNYPPLRKNHGMWEVIRKYVYKFAEIHVVQTQRIAEWIREVTKSDNVKVIPNSIEWPIPAQAPYLNPEDFLGDKENLILAAGSFKPQKGFDMLIEAARNFLRDGERWKLVILGDDKGESDRVTQNIKDLIANYGLEEHVILPGRAGNINDWYMRAEIFALSSRFEGFPNVLLEAMASGCATVSFDCNTGPSELITHLENGILVPVCDTEALAYHINELKKNDELRSSLAKNAVTVRERFSESVIMDRWKKTINEVLEL
jgi:glycosyltransferase involved in cell wall biosynthesis